MATCERSYLRLMESCEGVDYRSGYYTRPGQSKRLSEEYDVSMGVLVRDIEQLIQELLARRIVERESK